MTTDEKKRTRGKRFRGIHFTQEESRLLREAGFSEQSISGWRQGWALPSKKAALTIAQLTGRSLIEILYGRVDILAAVARGAPDATILTREERRSAGR